ncbi:MAG: hypothetical protein U0936_06540 [Planctomycetaceae bacterium]
MSHGNTSEWILLRYLVSDKHRHDFRITIRAEKRMSVVINRVAGTGLLQIASNFIVSG